ncbi:hypothetical protein JRQ81_012278 [Phrynocephalus forsythii]|uniref:Uncharacterized protein n=1 Tax=Phrynocephalus forsythii TaxID=171643 RepID=A0A9Q0X5K0_9SAUR|nr:hypothetical protein JRQ81_012278 [Phrynocephalus forsythii]
MASQGRRSEGHLVSFLRTPRKGRIDSAKAPKRVLISMLKEDNPFAQDPADGEGSAEGCPGHGQEESSKRRKHQKRNCKKEETRSKLTDFHDEGNKEDCEEKCCVIVEDPCDVETVYGIMSACTSLCPMLGAVLKLV